MLYILGGKGYLGGRLSEYLQSKGFEPIATDRNGVPYGKNKNSKTARLQTSTFGLISPNVLVIASGPSSGHLTGSMQDVYQNRAKYIGEILRVSNLKAGSTVIYLSSVRVYDGGIYDCPVKEDSQVLATTLYASSHIAAETELMSASEALSSRVFILRLANIVGYPLNDASEGWALAGNDFCRQAVWRSKIVLQSSPMSTRNFIGISTLLKFIEYIINTKELGGGIYNVSARQNSSLGCLANWVARRTEKLLNKKVTVVHPCNETAPSLAVPLSADKINSIFPMTDKEDLNMDLDEMIRRI